ncbi:hypothetical protein B0H12DRAFT_481268 [Mycena haematopus]|nr:hypothetical protein B0H12DRAFT_481268 [Mycena haematopus]
MPPQPQILLCLRQPCLALSRRPQMVEVHKSSGAGSDGRPRACGARARSLARATAQFLLFLRHPCLALPRRPHVVDARRPSGSSSDACARIRTATASSARVRSLASTTVARILTSASLKLPPDRVRRRAAAPPRRLDSARLSHPQLPRDGHGAYAHPPPPPHRRVRRTTPGGAAQLPGDAERVRVAAGP